MVSTSREIVNQALNCENPARAPRHLWLSPWANKHYPDESDQLVKGFKWDIGHIDSHMKEKGIGRGDAFVIGEFTDDWGATFQNIQEGVHGEVKDPLVKDWDADRAKIHIPREWLSVDIDAVNRDCDNTEAFMLAAGLPRPFEQLQFLRGSESVFMDLLLRPPAMMRFLKEMHEFYCELQELWAKTNVDALWFMDDWGSQLNLLIPPELWREIFKPMYKDYIDIAHGSGKKIFMHSDGMTLPILPDLIELGLDAINSQIFCVGLENLAPFAGQITFWGEIDRQHLLPHATPAEIDQAVRNVHANLWRQGGCFAMCEFTAGARPENVCQVYKTWDALTERI